jgi:hypothetical protein
MSDHYPFHPERYIHAMPANATPEPRALIRK